MDEKVIRKNGAVFVGYEDLSNVYDSLEIDSNTLICKYTSATGKYTIEVEVIGDVLVYYSSTSNFEDPEEYEEFDTPSEFNKDMKHLLQTHEFWDSDKIQVINNNWIEICFRDSDGQILESDVLEEAEGSSFEDLVNICEDYCRDTIKCRGLEE